VHNLPGLWIDHPDRDFAFSVETLLSEVYDQLDDTELVLRLFAALEPPKCSPPLRRRATSRPLGDKQTQVAPRAVFRIRLGYASAAAARYAQARPSPPARRSAYSPIPNKIPFASRNPKLASSHRRPATRKGRNEKGIRADLLIMGGFIGNRFGCTTADGNYAEIEVSGSTLAAAAQIVEDVVWCFDWLGPGNEPILRSPTQAPSMYPPRSRVEE